ncbi:kinase family protein [Striga asiatica]|uniref:Kinase family protein n=1 Tax=Striga asiatica TaxID=4170 RepID=A0A5A7QUD7_STRAF|nr:kinase family protein [Striga asiatica]
MASARSEMLHAKEGKEEERGSAADKEEEEAKIASFLEQIKDLSILPSMLDIEKDTNCCNLLQEWMTYNSRELRGIDLGDVKHYSDAELRVFTNGYSEDNLFCRTRHGRLFKAMDYNNRKLAVKTLDVSSPYRSLSYLTPPRLHAEIVLLRDPLIKSHPNFVKLIGYSCERKMAFVFDLDPKTSVHELLASDDFGWDARMKVAMDFGRLLKLSHENLIIYGYIDAKDIIFDQDSNAKFFDFGLHQRVKNKDEKIEVQCVFDDIGYIAPEICDYTERKWSMKSDVFSYGILLLNLICKKQGTIWSWFKQIKDGDNLIVSDSFEVDEHTKSGIIGLAMSCANLDWTCRPDMGTVVKNLEDLIG